MSAIDWNDFAKIDMRVGTIIRAEIFENARNPAYKIWADFWEKIGIQKTSAQITTLYSPEEIIGKQIIGVINFPPKQIGNFMSEFLLLGSIGKNKNVTLLSVDKRVENDEKIS